MATSLPPTLSWASSCGGTSATEPERTMTSNGASDAKPTAPSAVKTVALAMPARRKLARARSASSGSISSVKTCWALCAKRAAIWPEPAPISSTLSCLCTARSCSSRASIFGSSMAWPAGKGTAQSTNASDWYASGTNSSRLTMASNSKTAGSSTSHGRICCSIMLKRAFSRFIAIPSTEASILETPCMRCAQSADAACAVACAEGCVCEALKRRRDHSTKSSNQQ